MKTSIGIGKLLEY